MKLHRVSSSWLLPPVVAVALLLPRVAAACSVCFKDPSDPQTRGANSAVLLLLAVTVAVLMSFLGAIFCLWRRTYLYHKNNTLSASRPKSEASH